MILHRLSALSLRRQVFLAIILLLVPLLGAAIWSGSLSFQERGNELGQTADVLAHTVAAFIDRDPQRRDDAIETVPVPDGAVVTLSTTDGVILRTRGADVFQAARLPNTHRLGLLLPFRSFDADGVERVYGQARAQSGPGVVSVGLPMSLAFERAWTLWSRSLTILFFAVLSWLFIALWLSNRLLSAVGHLDRTAQRIAAGDFTPAPHKRLFSQEFTQLQAAFDAMLHRFNATRDRLDAQMAEERRIRQELESLQGQIIRQERLAAVGQLVSGVAHEINNPLQSISGFAVLLQMQQRDLPEPVKKDLNLIVRESARANSIIRNLAKFARQQPGPATRLRLGEVIASVAELRQRRLESEHIELQIEDASTQHVYAVITELQQVVLNFVVNAEQALLASGRVPGRVTIRTRDRASCVLLEVEDTGPGIDAVDEPRLFEPFFTTKPVGQGTGLGLSISYGIIESLGGKIGYRPAPVSGAVFYIELPADGN